MMTRTDDNQDTTRNGRPAGGGWFRIANAVVDEFGARIGQNGFAVLCVLARFADSRGRCYPSISTIGRLTKLGRRTVMRTLKTLERFELISTVRTNGSPNHYVLNAPPTSAKPDTGAIRDTGANPDTGIPAGTRANSDTPPVSSLAPDQCQPGHRNNTQLTRHKKKTHPSAESFDRFWSAYPRKVNKKDAAKVFAKIAPNDDLLAQMLTALERQKQSRGWTKDDGEFIPYPATWLNGERWEDDDTSAASRSPPNYAREQMEQAERERNGLANTRAAATGPAVP